MIYFLWLNTNADCISRLNLNQSICIQQFRKQGRLYCSLLQHYSIQTTARITLIVLRITYFCFTYIVLPKRMSSLCSCCWQSCIKIFFDLANISGSVYGYYYVSYGISIILKFHRVYVLHLGPIEEMRRMRLTELPILIQTILKRLRY